METSIIYCRLKENNMELYLNDVHEKECEYKIEQEEMLFIQTGIDTLVQELVDLIVRHDYFDKFLSDAIDDYFTKKDVYHEKKLVEVYFPIQSDCSLQRYVAGNASYVKIVKSTIIKVGSFNDGTKNNFPDEFDFIFPLLGIRAEFDISVSLIDLMVKHTVIDAISEYGHSLHYPPMSEEHQATRALYFKEYKGKHGPAFKIEFIYSNGSGEQRPLHVDLVPACKLIDSNTQQWFVEKVRQDVEPKTFHDEILSARNCLLVNGKLAFTEIEQHFMKNYLLKKHVKVYRILKYLLNGNGDGEKLEEYFKYSSKCIYTSYCIKILMIYHHDSCINTGTKYLGPCVLQMLKEMSKYESKDKLPSFTGEYFGSQIFCVLPYLKSTIRALQLMQTSEEDYNYKKDKIKSVSGQYLDSVTPPRTKRRRCVLL